jgi:hypothetical protein
MMSESTNLPLVRVRLPVPPSTDPRFEVTINEKPWPLRIYFLLVGDEGNAEWINVGFEIGERFEAAPGSRRVTRKELGTDPKPIDAIALQRIAANYPLYVNLARGALALEWEGV